jgi:hypothetical protein
MSDITSPKPFCFVLMPFSDEFADVYQIGIKEACEAAGAYCERVDEQIFAETILQRIYNQISKADFIVADMTGRNPNVFYEVGYAHALGKRTILLTKSAADIPFDLKHFPHIVYGDKLSILRDELSKRVAWHVANPASANGDSRIEIDLYSNDTALSAEKFFIKLPKDKAMYFPLTIHNRSSRIYESGTFKVGIVAPTLFIDLLRNEGILTKLPHGQTLLIPNAYDSCRLIIFPFSSSHEELTMGHEFPIQIRIFTPVGTRDFPCIVQVPDD